MNHPNCPAWVPGESDIASSCFQSLATQLGLARLEELYPFSVRHPDRYWRAVNDFCGIRWDRPYLRYLDESAGAAFPRWFAGGRLNWTRTILAWAEQPEHAGRIAIAAENERGDVARLTYAELRGRVARFAGGLAGLGIGRGDRVGLLMGNGIEAAVSLLAVAYVGAIVVPLFSGFGADAIAARLAACSAGTLIASTGFERRGRRIDLHAMAAGLRERLPGLARIIWHQTGTRLPDLGADLDWQDVCAGAGPLDAPLSMDPNDPFMVIYTSGTTGKPKGAVHVHGGFPLKIAHDAAVHFDIKAGDVVCWPADMGWIAGALVTASALMRGATLVCYDGAPDFPDWSRMSRLVERHGVTHFGSAPTLIRGMAANAAVATRGDVGTLRLLITAGEGIDPEHFNWFQASFGRGACPVINYTGGTEVSGALLSNVVVRPIVPSGFNMASPGVAVEVADAAGATLEGSVGELVVRRPFVGMTHSFWQDDQRYLDTYWQAIPGTWVHGDLAMRDADGVFYLLGRSDDTIKVAGKRLGPAEVEEVLLELPGVAEVAAIGVDDAVKGQRLVVFAVPAAGHAGDLDALGRVLADHVDQRLGKPFRPGGVHFVAQLPKTRSGKIMRRLIRSAYAGQPAGDLTALDDPAALDAIRRCVGAAAA
ncbi:AMP-binding protein [Cupriavidus sp. 30B13]|uniref:AMP-binding protein n=1 Tax=Cupriavidus sp. 30B13 TaxID=3384241 RepID=UPI003B908649